MTTFYAISTDSDQFFENCLVGKIRTSRTKYAIASGFGLPDYAGSGAAAGGPGTIASVSVLSPTSIRATFANPVLDNAALANPDNYQITPALEVHSVTPEAAANPSYVDLEIDEQQTGVSYDIEIVAITEA